MLLHKKILKALVMIIVFSVLLSSSVVSSQTNTATDSITISLAHVVDTEKDSYQLLLAAPLTATSLEICEGECTATGVQKFSTKIVYSNNSRNFFQANAVVLMEAGLILGFRATDSSGNVVAARTVQFDKNAASNTNSTTNSNIGINNGGNNANISTSDTQIRSIVSQNCGGAACHQAYVQNLSAIPKSAAIARIQNGSMPKGRNMSSDDRAALLKYLQN